MRRTRKAHTKSRGGCTNCKKRHSKCDEQGPPCASCVSRKITSTCNYEFSAIKSRPHVHPRPSSPRPISGDAPSCEPIHAPSFMGCSSGINSLLHLELMHRWSTLTYKAFIIVPDDADFMQLAVPRGGIEYEFLLNGILTLAALDIASSEHPQAAYYSRQAMEFYDASSRSFRTQLMQVESKNLDWAAIYSSMVSYMSVAMINAAPAYAAPPRSAIEATMTMFELLIGSAILFFKHMTELMAGSYAPSISYAKEAVSAALPLALDNVTEEHFKGLRTLVDYLAGNLHHIHGSGTPKRFKSWNLMYQDAVRQLYRCFLEDEKKKVAGMCLAYPSMIGPDFLQAVRERDPMALVLLMSWALLVDRLANVAWWAKDLGPKLVRETTEILLEENQGIIGLPEFYECIVWANGQLGRRKFRALSWTEQPPRLEGVYDAQIGAIAEQ